jgi:hypothetical protein
VNTLTIPNSTANTWAATTLTINGWVGAGGSGGSGTSGKIMVGVGGLSNTQLNKIFFTNYGPGAVITPSGELVPNSLVYYSQGSITPNNLSSWNTLRTGGGIAAPNFTSGNSIFVIQDTHNMASTGNWTVSGTNARIWIESGGTLTANNQVTLGAAAYIQMDDGATYIHNNNGNPTNTVFAGTEIFAANSNFIINNWNNTNTSVTTGVSLPYGNLEINWNAGGNWTQSMSGAIDLTAGNFIIASLGNAANEFRLTPASNGTALSLGIGGNLDVTSGVLAIVSGGGNGSKVCDVNVARDVNISGTIDMNSANTSSGSISLNLKGNFSVSGAGVLKNSLGNSNSSVNFINADSIQTFISTAAGINSGTISFNAGNGTSTNTLKLLSNFIMGNAGSLNVLNGATLNCGTNIVQATVANTQGNFKLNSGATILVGAAGGISANGASGNIQTNTSRLFNAGANYIYNGLSAQVTGTGLTAAANLEIINPSGVTLSVNASVNDTLKLTDGNINCAANTLAVTNQDVDAIVHTNGYVIGKLKRAIATGANVYQYPIGSLSGYTPAILDFSSVSGAGSVTIRTTEGIGGNYPAALSATKRLKRDWAITNSGLSGFEATANFTFLPADIIGGANITDLRAYRAEPGPALAYLASDDYDIAGTTFSFFNLTSFSNTADFSEFGAGECNGGFTATFTKTMASSCGGAVDGTITVTATGGTGPYLYNWTGPNGYTANTAAITGLATGDYTVEVSEISGCSVIIPDITIWQALPPLVTNNGGESASCVPTGYIALYGSYGVQPYTYSIDGINYSATNTFNNLTAGNYTGYVKDLRGCVSTKPNIVVTAAAPISINSYARAASSCANNGTIEIYRTGGISPFTYSLNDVTYQASNVFSSLPNGTYTAWVKDSKGCKSSQAGIVVTKAPTVTVTSSKVNTSACSNTGSIVIRAGGGVPGYTYSLNNVTYQPGNTFGGLAAGTYNGWVQDSKGCKSVQFGIVIGTDAASSITVTASSAVSSGCNSSGSIQLFKTGGVAPFSYSLDNVTYQAGNTFTGLANGTYTGWVKDARGCRASKTGIIVNRAAAVTSTESHTNSSTCINDGTIQLRPAGGVAPYTYSLNDITYQAADNFSGLAAGNYTGWVKDVNGCKASVNATIALNTMSVTAYAGAASSCAAGDGSIQLFRTGGVGPYTYSIDGSNYSSNYKFQNLPAGIYTGYVKDSKACIAVLSNISVGPNCPPNFANNSKLSIFNGKNNDDKVSEKNLFSISAYPNPTTTEFNLVITGSNKEKVVINVSDYLGRKVFSSTSDYQHQLSFGKQLKPGMYTVEVIQGNKYQTIKVIKE